jgi:hypothetical protein
MSQHPDASGKESLHDAIQTPKSCSDGSLGNVLGRHVVVENVESGTKENNVAEDVVETLDG